MSYKPKKKEVFIKQFEKFEKIKAFKKPRSPLTILFCTDDWDDKWLIDIVEYKSKTGLVTDNYIITEKQIPRFTDIYNNHGYVEVDLTEI